MWTGLGRKSRISVTSVGLASCWPWHADAAWAWVVPACYVTGVGLGTLACATYLTEEVRGLRVPVEHTASPMLDRPSQARAATRLSWLVRHRHRSDGHDRGADLEWTPGGAPDYLPALQRDDRRARMGRPQQLLQPIGKGGAPRQSVARGKTIP